MTSTTQRMMNNPKVGVAMVTWPTFLNFETPTSITFKRMKLETSFFSLLDPPWHWQVLYSGWWMTPKGAWPRSRVLLRKQWDKYPRSTERIYCFNAFMLPFSVLKPYCCTTVFPLSTTRTSFFHFKPLCIFFLFSPPSFSRGFKMNNNNNNSVSFPAPVHGHSTAECGRLPKYNVHRMSLRCSR